jgi:hypothetical protein
MVEVAQSLVVVEEEVWSLPDYYLKKDCPWKNCVRYIPCILQDESNGRKWGLRLEVGVELAE